DKLEKASDELNMLQQNYDDLTSSRESLTQDQRQYLEKREELTQALSELSKEEIRLESQKEKTEERLDNLVSYLWSEYELTPSEAENLRDTELDNPGRIRRHTQELKSAIRKLGNVNVNAIVTKDIDLGVNYSWNYAKTKTGDEWSLLERSVRNTLTLSSDFHHTWGLYSLNVRLSARLQSKTYYPNYENAPGYGVWNLNTTHTFRVSDKLVLEPYIGIDNIFDKVDKRPDSSLRKYALYNPGRMILAGLRIFFD
ncbi:MAG: TonB-dependent receptor, partial [Bacteroidales bacterium]|nr:TonB-dependent receptor [Bacteroidales bacterium]